MEAEKTDFVSIPTQNKERVTEPDSQTRDAAVSRTAFRVDPDGNDPTLHNRYIP